MRAQPQDDLDPGQRSGGRDRNVARRRLSVIEALRNVLPEGKAELAVRSFDVVGDVAVIRVPEPLESERFLIAQTIQRCLPYVRTVLRQVGAVGGEFRTRRLEWLSGENRTTTIHKEYGCLFEMDLAKVYFSPRLLYERFRIAALCRNSSVHENVLNMFSGVGCFSIMIARGTRGGHVYSVDLNPDAISYQLRNIRLNKTKGRVTAVYGDAQALVESLFEGKMHRVLMPLPEKAYACLESAVAAIGPEGGTIHYYDFMHAYKHEDPVGKVASKVVGKMDKLQRRFETVYGRAVRTTGPNWYQVVLDVVVQ